MKVSTKKLATIIAALRFFQANYDSDDEEWQELFSLHFIEHKPLTYDEIEALCERLGSQTLEGL
ncbi:hypothetical protein H6G27_23985 [Nostoc linckia FACHB-104]|nr:hypothetical protein [Nostoc linckia FACHB-104]